MGDWYALWIQATASQLLRRCLDRWRLLLWAQRSTQAAWSFTTADLRHDHGVDVLTAMAVISNLNDPDRLVSVQNDAAAITTNHSSGSPRNQQRHRHVWRIVRIARHLLELGAGRHVTKIADEFAGPLINFVRVLCRSSERAESCDVSQDHVLLSRAHSVIKVLDMRRGTAWLS
jgi:hypothetical protein